MSVDKEESYRSALLDETNRRIIRFCREPRTSGEIVNRITPSQTGQPLYYETLVSGSLKQLEKLGMIAFAEGKWKSEKTAIEVLEKYFGE